MHAQTLTRRSRVAGRVRFGYDHPFATAWYKHHDVFVNIVHTSGMHASCEYRTHIMHELHMNHEHCIDACIRGGAAAGACLLCVHCSQESCTQCIVACIRAGACLMCVCTWFTRIMNTMHRSHTSRFMPEVCASFARIMNTMHRSVHSSRCMPDVCTLFTSIMNTMHRSVHTSRCTPDVCT